MENLNAILLVLQVLLAIGLIALILLQHGKGADAGAAFGSGASATVFGAKGSGNFLTKATAILATLFFITCLGLAYIASHREGPGSIVDSVVNSQPVEEVAPAADSVSDLPPMTAEPAGNSDQSQSDLPPSE
jgi:preprotein translocase subunit SecG